MTEEKKARGRPKGYRKQDPADKQLPRVRVTQKQLDAYKAASKQENKTFSAWVRESLDNVSLSNHGQGGGTGSKEHEN